MGRRIVTKQMHSLGTETPAKEDDYATRLMKYVPTESVGFWLAVSGIIQSAEKDVPKAGLLWAFFVIGLVFTYFWIDRETKEAGSEKAWTQIAVSCGAFVVWIFASGGAITESLTSYKPVYGSLLLITYTAAIGFIIPPEK
ncbi:MAG: hypothetical protein HC860_20635 [Alkalinema sp. RU_4_3]|nr:hypothetical protein [Alkalinema sp. RU_4_3]